MNHETILLNTYQAKTQYQDFRIKLYEAGDLELESLLDPSKFLNSQKKFSYIGSNFVKQSLDILVNFIGINKIFFDFKDVELNDKFKDLFLEKNLQSVIETSILQMLLLGYSFIQTDNYGSYNLMPGEVGLYVNPDFERRFTDTYVINNKNIKTIYTKDLIVTTANNKVIETAFNELPENPIQLFNYSFSTIKQTLGKSIFTDLIIAKIIKYNQLLQLCFKLQKTNLSPKMQINQDTANLLRKAVVKAKSWFERLTGTSEINNIINTSTLKASLQESRNTDPSSDSLLDDITHDVMNKELVVFADSGKGDNKFLTNPQTITDAVILMEKLKDSIYNDLAVSDSFFNSENIKVGQDPSSKALKMLMNNTVAKIESIKTSINSPLAKVAQNTLALEYPKFKQIPTPKIVFPDLFSDVLHIDTGNQETAIESILERISTPE